MDAITAASDTRPVELVTGPTVTLYRRDIETSTETDDQGVERTLYTYRELRFPHGEYELVLAGTLPPGVDEWTADLRRIQRSALLDQADKLIAEAGVDMKYEVGTMIEIPRAALTADEIAKEAEFFSFGTNDLTQMTFGFSRDDAGKFLSYYYDNKVYESDPFAHLDQNGVGKLVEMAAKLGRSTRPELGLGICGEHGGDPTSVEFCHKVGLDYVSCSPFRVPIARLAAAQAAIKNPRK